MDGRSIPLLRACTEQQPAQPASGKREYIAPLQFRVLPYEAVLDAFQ